MDIKQLKEDLEDFWIDVRYFIPDNYMLLKERLSRAWAYACFSWLNYDFDSVCLYNLMSFKLKRIRHCLENGIAVQEKEDMLALDEAIAICDRLYAELYEDKYYERLDDKWGKLTTSSGKWFNSVREKRVTEEDHENYVKDLLSACDQAENDRKADIDKLAKILKDHARSWWS